MYGLFLDLISVLDIRIVIKMLDLEQIGSGWLCGEYEWGGFDKLKYIRFRISCRDVVLWDLT